MGDEVAGNLQDENGETSNKIEENEEDEVKKQNKTKVYKKGIVYLAFIPPSMPVIKLRQIMSQYGEVGRIFLQPAPVKGTKKNKKKRKARNFTEGWVEFLKKRTAKQLAINLNNQPIDNKKGSKYHDYLWNLKYLPRFKWVHLSERLTYERAVFKQRMRTEISQAKRVAAHFAQQVERNKPSTGNTLQLSELNEQNTNLTKKEKKQQSRDDFIKNLFS